MRSHAPKPRTRQALWNVKQERPELFALDLEEQTRRAEVLRGSDGPPGFEAAQWEGWWHHPLRNVYMHKLSGRLCWLDPSTKELSKLHDGETLALTCTSGAAVRPLGPRNSTAVASSSSSAPAATGPASLSTPVPKHVIVPDLHRAAQAMKLDLEHIDRPAAMVALFGESAAGGTPVDVAARAFHEKLIKCLAAFRGEWSEQALRTSITRTMGDIAGAEGDARFTAAVALVVGGRAVAFSNDGARFCFAGGVHMPGSQACLPGGRTSCVRLGVTTPRTVAEAAQTSGELSIVMLLSGSSCGRILEAWPDGDVLAAAGPRLQDGRPRAASVALLQAAQARGALGQLAVACVRLFGTGLPGSSTSETPEQAAKRRKLAGAPSQVRVRQILLRHWKGTGQQPNDPIRRKVVSRTPDEAEAQMLDVLDGLIAESSSFSAPCKAISECQSALKGGELIGDLGWLDRSVDTGQEGKPKPRTPGAAQAIRSVVPAPVRRAAFELDVGELSDLVSSEIGIHILLRTA